jgi:PKD domain-containing protein
MFRYQFSRLKIYAAPIALVVSLSAASVFAQKPQAVSAANAPLTLSLISDANIVRACDNSGAPQVQLTAKAVSPNGNPIKYKWTTSDGTIIGDGAIVTWNLAGLKPGYHKASLDIVSAGTEGTCQAFSSVSVLVNPCAEVRPVCPAIEISCPTNVGIDQPLTFTSRYSGGVPANITPVYNWTVSAGTIIEGQGTDTIKVDTKGLAGETVRASLSMGGYNTLECAADCAVSIPLPRPVGRKFDEFPDISRNDEKARLDNYAIELQNDPTATGYVIVYPGRTSKKAEVQDHFGRVIEYLVHSRGIDQSRIKTIEGPKRDQLHVELWITPQGATPPNP